MQTYQDFMFALPDDMREDETMAFVAEQLWDPFLRGDDWHAVRDALDDYMSRNYYMTLDDFLDKDEYGEWYDSTH